MSRMHQVFLYVDEPSPGVFRAHAELTEWMADEVHHQRSETEMLPDMEQVWDFAKEWASDAAGSRGGGYYALHLNPKFT